MNEKSWSRIFSRTGLALSAFLISSAIAMTAIYTGFTVIGHGYFSADMQLIVNAICMYLIGFPVAWMIFQTVPHPDPIRKTEKWEVGSWIGLYLICTGVAVIGNMISTLLAFFIGPAAGANVVETVILQSNPLLNFILTVIAAPVVEELLTRKLLIDKILLYGEKTAILVSALLFGLMHGNFYQFFYAFGIGLILAYAYVRTGKISGTIAIHMAINFMGSEVILLYRKSGSDAWYCGNYGDRADGFVCQHPDGSCDQRNHSSVLFLEEKKAVSDALRVVGSAYYLFQKNPDCSRKSGG